MNMADISSKTVALAPFNAISMALSVLLEERGIRTAVIYDNNKKLHGQTFRNIPIRGAADDDLRGATIVVCSFISLKQIAKQLAALNAGSVVPYERIIDKNDLPEMLAAFERSKADGELNNINAYHRNVMFGSGDLSIRAALPPLEAKNGVVLPLLMVVVTEVCNLRCVECSHLMQYFTEPKTYSVDAILENFETLYRSTAFIRHLSVTGGEPFLHRDLATLIEHFAHYENIGYIGMNTNGTILPEEEFFRRISNVDNIMLRMADYGKISKHKDAIADMCVKYGIRHSVLSNATWYGGLRITEVNEDAASVQNIFASCSDKSVSLAEDRFAKCNLGLFADILGAVPPGLPGMDSCLKISAKNFTADSVARYLESAEPLQACSICTAKSRTREQAPPAVQTDMPLCYKKYRRV